MHKIKQQKKKKKQIKTKQNRAKRVTQDTYGTNRNKKFLHDQTLKKNLAEIKRPVPPPLT